MDSIQAIIQEASNSLGCGDLQNAYVLYLKALDVAIQELSQIQFINPYTFLLPDNMNCIVALAQMSLQQAHAIAYKATSPTRQKIHETNCQCCTLPSFNTNLYLTDSKISLGDLTHPSMPPAAPPKPKFSTLPLRTRNLADTEPDLGDNTDDEKVAGSDDEEDGHPIATMADRRRSSENLHTQVMARMALPDPVSLLSQDAPTGTDGSVQDELVWMTMSAVDPNCLVKAHTSPGDALTFPAHAESLPSIPKPPLLAICRSLQKKLAQLEQSAKLPPSSSQQHAASVAKVKASLHRVRTIHMSASTVPTIRQLPAALIAYQLTLIDSAIFRNIHPSALLQHTPKSPHTTVVASMDFFNYLTRLVEHSILLQQEATGRAQHMHHWIKVASKCHRLLNFQTLKAIVCALGTPPIQRLKRSWAMVPKKSLTRLKALGALMSETANYEQYRRCLDSMTGRISAARSNPEVVFRAPIVPFLGTFLHDLTYLTAAMQANTSSASSCNSLEHPRLADLLDLFVTLQKHPPYASTPPPAYVKQARLRRRLSYALMGGGGTPTKRYAAPDDEHFEPSVQEQQCLVTQYLLTQCWVSEKTVDELSALREPPKPVRQGSTATETLSCQPLFSGDPLLLDHERRKGSGIISTESTSSSSSSNSSTNSDINSSTEDLTQATPTYLVTPQSMAKERRISLLARKSIDLCTLKTTPTEKKNLPYGLCRHVSFEELDRKQPHPSVRRTSIFRCDFWRHSMSATSSERSSLEEPVSRLKIQDRRRSNSSTALLTLELGHYLQDKGDHHNIMTLHPLDSCAAPLPTTTADDSSNTNSNTNDSSRDAPLPHPGTNDGPSTNTGVSLYQVPTPSHLTYSQGKMNQQS